MLCRIGRGPEQQQPRPSLMRPRVEVISVTGSQEIGLQKDSLVIGTWNVCTLNHNRKDVLIHELERYKWDILGLCECETRWKNFWEEFTKGSHKLWYSGDENRHEYGVGILVNKEKLNSVISFTPISNRLMSLRVAAKPKNITIFQVYAPSSTHTDEKIEEFYEQEGFRPVRSTVEQICNIRILIEKCIEHQQELYHNFIDFKKAFDHVWHEGLLGLFGIED